MLEVYRTDAWESLVKEVTKNNLDTVGTQGVRLSDEDKCEEGNYCMYLTMEKETKRIASELACE
jgi:hypothetical protein